MSGYSQLWCFSETAGGHIPGRVPETTQWQGERGEPEVAQENTTVFLQLFLHSTKNNHDIAKPRA